MSDEINRKFCIEYCVRRGVPEWEAEKFSNVILCAYKVQRGKSLKQMCNFSLKTLEDIKKSAVHSAVHS